MKTIKVSDEIYEKLMDISKELNTQNHLGTAMPYLFQIIDYKRVSCGDGESDDFILIDTDADYNEIEVENYEDVIKYLKEIEIYDELEEEINEILESNKKFKNDIFSFGEIVELVIDKTNIEKMYFKKISELTNGFFTRKEAESFLKSNHYHFTDKAHVFLNHLWRNEEMKQVMTFLCELSGGKLHT